MLLPANECRTQRIEQKLGPNGIKVVTQLMGLMLAVIGVQMAIAGVSGAVDAYTAAGSAP